MRFQAAFVDRDGTLGGDGHFCHPRDFVPYPCARRAIGLLRDAGIRVFAITNQYRISRGEAAQADFAAELIGLGCDAAYICPHAADAGCPCQKPRPGMLVRAAAEHGLDLARCAVIGDVGSTDMLAAAAVGAAKILVRTGWGLGGLAR